MSSCKMRTLEIEDRLGLYSLSMLSKVSCRPCDNQHILVFGRIESEYAMCVVSFARKFFMESVYMVCEKAFSTIFEIFFP